jgi:hypothetical protein
MCDVVAGPAGIALALRRGALGAQGFAATGYRKPGGRLAEANGCETVASFVLRGPAGWAFLAFCPFRILSRSTEAQLRKARACPIRRVRDVLSRPAGVALAVRRGAVRAEFAARPPRTRKCQSRCTARLHDHAKRCTGLGPSWPHLHIECVGSDRAVGAALAAAVDVPATAATTTRTVEYIAAVWCVYEQAARSRSVW